MFYFLKLLMSVPTNKQTHALRSYGSASYKFNETHLLDKVPPGMKLHLKVPKLNERPQAKYHNCNTLGGIKSLKTNHVQNISKNHEKTRTH